MASEAFSSRKTEGRVRAGFLRAAGADPAFVKRTAAHSRLGGFIERLRGSRARRALAGAAMLEAARLAHPAPLAAFEERGSLGAVNVSYLLTEALADAQTLSVFALGRNGELRGDLPRRFRITRAVAREVRHLHDAGLYTRDLQETNLMVEGEGETLRIFFVDLEDFRRASRVTMRRRILNLVHLDRSIGRFAGQAGRLRFLYDYLGGRPQRAAARRIVARVLRTRAALDRRARRKQGGESSTGLKVRRRAFGRP